MRLIQKPFDIDWVHTFTMDNPGVTKVYTQPGSNAKKYFLERIGGTENMTIPLSIGVHSVGRTKKAHVIIKSKFCNRKHCRLIVDCESVSVFVEVSDRRYCLSTCTCHHAFRHSIGDFVFSFICAGWETYRRSVCKRETIQMWQSDVTRRRQDWIW